MGPQSLSGSDSYLSLCQEERSLSPRPGTSREVHLKFFENGGTSLALLDAIERGGCACWIRNTVHDAIAVFRIIKKENSLSVHPMIFHARFVLGDRLERERNYQKVREEQQERR